LQDIQKRYYDVSYSFSGGSQDAYSQTESQANDISDAQSEEGAQCIVGKEASFRKGGSLEEYYSQ